MYLSSCREFPQIENVDVDMNVDVASHPVGRSTPQILLQLFPVLNKILHNLFSKTKGKLFSNKRESNLNKGCNSVVALNFKIVGVKGVKGGAGRGRGCW